MHYPLGLLPVLCFLAALVLLDSYKLVRLRWVVACIAAGVVVAILTLVINSAVFLSITIEFASYSRYIAPIIEESLKAAIIVLLLARNRIGFLVDSAIFGFAVGAGFAVFENWYMLRAIPATDLGTWVIRGFGTAVMHGGATAIFAVSTRALLRRHKELGPTSILPGLIMASLVHSVFNHFFFSPIGNTLAVLIFLPIVVAVVYQRSERAVAEWLDTGFDANCELLNSINSGDFSTSNIGLYLTTLKEKFRGEVVADLLCYLRLHVELSLRAKGLMMMRDTGFTSEIGDQTREKLNEIKYLDKSIGKTGKLALKPIMTMSRKDLWSFYMLRQ